VPNVVWAFATALLLAGEVSAEIFKCKASNGLPLYQNFPCEIDSLGLPATGKPTPSPESIQAKAPAPVSQRGDTSLPQPRVGMTADEVRKTWGEPPEILQDEPRSGRVAIWQYGDGRIVRINQKQRVISIQQ